MSDSQLAEWLGACDDRSNRVGAANSATRSWKSLLADARLERERRTSAGLSSRDAG
jgi:hypothetical protein